MIIEVTGSDLEKIKGDFESTINGMNMTGAFDYPTYCELFDVAVDCIQRAYELGVRSSHAQESKRTCGPCCKAQAYEAETENH